MRTIITFFIFLFPLITLGQIDYSLNRIVDTLNVIELNSSIKQDVIFISDEIEVIFCKEQAIDVLNRTIDEFKKENRKEDYFENLTLTKNYLTENQNIILKRNLNKLFNGNVPWFESEIYKVTIVLYEVICDLLEFGNVVLLENGIKQNKIIKAEITEWDDYSSTTSICFILENGNVIWYCPPITHSDFD